MGFKWTRRTDKKRVIGLALLLIHLPRERAVLVRRILVLGSQSAISSVESVLGMAKRLLMLVVQHSEETRTRKTAVRVGSKNGM